MIGPLRAALEGRYDVRLEVGEGGMARVYMADDLRHGRQVALKVLKPELAAVVGAERFLAEIRTTAALQHPQILPLFDSGEADGFLFYVMPYVEGESLRDRLDREKHLPVDEAVAIAARLADALDYAHRQGVVHRDIKPANVLLHEGRPILADFGIALAVESGGGGRLTETGLSVGTPLYMSPEQATGYHDVGPATDVYALGCVLYEMLAGRPPYTGPTPQAILGQIVTGALEPPREKRPTVPPNVDAAVRKALERLPADRFAAARDLAAALSDPAFRHGEEGDAARSAGRWKPVAAAGWALALLLALGLGWLVTAGRADGPAPLRYGSLVLADGLRIAGGVSEPLAVSPDGSRVAWVAEGEEGRELWTRLLSEPAGRRLDGVGPLVGSIAFAPDGDWIAYHDAGEGRIRRVFVVGGVVETVATVPAADAGDFGGLDWGADGTIVFAAAGSLFTVPAAGGTPAPLTEVRSEEEVEHRLPAFLPGGGGVVFTVSGTSYPWGQRVAVLRPGGDVVHLTEGDAPRVTDDGTLLFGREGSVWAARLADDGSGLRAEPVRVLDGVDFSRGSARAAAHFDVAGDGTLVHLPPSERVFDGLIWVDRSGGAEVLLTVEDPQMPRGTFNLLAPRISPDGRRLAFRGSGAEPDFRLYVYDLERGALSPVPVDRNADWPVWSPDGSWLVFNYFDEEAQNLYRVPADGAAPAEPFQEPNPYQQHALDFTPDGSRLIVAHRPHRQATDSDIVVLPANGEGEPEPLLTGPEFVYQGALSPDGRWLAFVSRVSGQAEVYVTDFPGADTRVKISTGGGFSPIWSRESEELFYRRGGDGAVMAVPVAADAAFTAGAPTRLFGGSYATCCVWGRSFDVVADGSRFLMIRTGEESAGAPRVEVVRNWLARVARRLAER